MMYFHFLGLVDISLLLIVSFVVYSPILGTFIHSTNIYCAYHVAITVLHAEELAVNETDKNLVLLELVVWNKHNNLYGDKCYGENKAGKENWEGYRCSIISKNI